MIAAHAPAAIILDLLMPEVDGFDVLRELRRTSPQALARVIVVTAATIRNRNHPDLDLVWEFFRKPLDIEQLGRCVLDCVHASSNKTGRGSVYETPTRP